MASISPERRARLDREKTKNASGNAKYFSMKSTPKAVIRLIPLGPDDDVAHKVTSYYLNNKSYVDPEGTHGKPGVISRACRALKRLDTIPEAADIAKGIEENRKTRYLMKIIDRSSPTDVKWFESPRSIYEVIFKLFDEDGEDPSHPKEGRDIRVSKTGSGIGTEYSARPLDKSLLLPTVEERKAIRAAALDFNVSDELSTDEPGALQALKDVIPRNIWKLIQAEVTKGLEFDSGHATSNASAEDDEGDAAASTTEDEDDQPAKPPAKTSAKAAPVATDEDESPVKPSKAAASDADDSDDEAVAPVKPTPAATKPAAAKAGAPAREDRYRAPAAVAAKSDDDDDAAPVATPAAKSTKAAKPAASDDDDDA